MQDQVFCDSNGICRMYRAMLVFPSVVDLVNGGDRIGRIVFVKCVGRPGYKLLVQQHVTQFVIIGKAKSLDELCVYSRCVIPRGLDTEGKRLRARLIRIPAVKALAFRCGRRSRFRQVLPVFDCQQLIKLFTRIKPEDPVISPSCLCGNAREEHTQ